MVKKTVIVVLCVVMAVALCGVFIGCEKKPDTKIVYLGDSIAEAVLGASPLSERENYGYYALIGKTNNYEYINRSVSGHKTDMMFKYISQGDESAQRIRTHIMTADIIHVSILGNDMLQDDVGGLIVETAEEERLHTGTPKRDEILNFSRTNIAAIVGKLRELNPDAVLMFQTVYNPVYFDTHLISARARERLAEDPLNYTTEEDFRYLGGLLISSLNNVLREYLADHPDEFYIIDAYKAFSDIYAADATRGKKLIYPDDTHPSNEGHAVMAELIENQLVELGLADEAAAVKRYKEIRLDQLKRLYPDANTKDMKKAIKNCNTFGEVTNVYFRAIDGLTPQYC